MLWRIWVEVNKILRCKNIRSKLKETTVSANQSRNCYKLISKKCEDHLFYRKKDYSQAAFQGVEASVKSTYSKQT